jgi:hypothetical protein
VDPHQIAKIMCEYAGLTPGVAQRSHLARRGLLIILSVLPLGAAIGLCLRR